MMREIVIEILCGDVTKLTTVALIVPQYPNQTRCTALTKRLMYYGCEEGMRYFDDAVKSKRFKTGSVVGTSGGGNCKKLIHAMMLGTNDNQLVVDCVRAVLEFADERKMTSLALPLERDSCVSVHDMAIVIVEIVKQYQEQNSSIREFTIVVNFSGREYERLIESICCGKL